MNLLNKEVLLVFYCYFLALEKHFICVDWGHSRCLCLTACAHSCPCNSAVVCGCEGVFGRALNSGRAKLQTGEGLIWVVKTILKNRCFAT